jgi:HipA-like kinase
VVNPVIVNISREFVELLKGDDSWQYASKSLGYNYGSGYIKNYQVLPVNQPLNSSQLSYAQTVFAFDVLIQNPDRTVDKPNMLTNRKEIIILDHELAFSFIFDLVTNPNPWIIKQANLTWINHHYLLPKIKGKEFDFEKFSKRIGYLDDNFWETSWNLIPENWRRDQFETIKNHFTAISENKAAFILE